MAAEFNIVDMRRGPLLEDGQQLMLGPPEAALTAIRLRPNNQVQEVEAELTTAADDEGDRTPVDEGCEQASISQIGHGRRHPCAVEGSKLLPAHLAVRLVGLPGRAAYHASKHGVIGLTKSAALDVAAQGIRVNAVCPGCIDTPMGDSIDPAAMKEFLKEQPIGRMGRPEEVAAAVFWLCSPGASMVLGVALPVDGGFVAH